MAKFAPGFATSKDYFANTREAFAAIIFSLTVDYGSKTAMYSAFALSNAVKALVLVKFAASISALIPDFFAAVKAVSADVRAVFAVAKVA